MERRAGSLFGPLAVCLLSASLGAHAAAAESEKPSAPPTPPDPAQQLVSNRLSPEEEKACRKFFEQLGSPDFDVRQQALNGLIAKGTAVFPLAEEFANHRDPEVAAQAKGLRQRVLSDYDGYLPTAPALKAALRKTRIKLSGSFGAERLREVARNAGITMVVDPSMNLPEVLFEGLTDDGEEGRPRPDPNIDLQSFVQLLMQRDGISGVPRGDFYLLTSVEKARALATQRHAFDWSGLGLNRDEAERVVKALQGFFPLVSTELHAGSEVLLVCGEEEAIARAARLIALLKPGSSDAIWPIPPPLTGGDKGRAESAALLLKELSAPATLVLSAEDPLEAIAQLKKQHHELFMVTNTDGDVSQNPPFPKDVSGMSPLRLSLRNQPLGLILRWLERRARFPGARETDLVLSYEIGPGGRLQFQVRSKAPRVLDFYVAGADVGFIYPRTARPGAESDAAARTALLEALETHLALFPTCDLSRDLALVRGRLLMQGHYDTLARVLELVGAWRTIPSPQPSPQGGEGRVRGAPPPADWKKALDGRLDAPIEWDGRRMSGGNLLPALRKLGRVDILLEDAPDGTAPQFELTAQDAQLLPPGKYPLRALLDDLAHKTGAQWRIVLGAIVLTPKSKG